MEIDYNTQLEPLLIKEYGRNVQRMINHAITIKDRDERNLAARDIIKVMELINPDPKKGADHEHKLWDHLHIIAENRLDVDSVYEKPIADLPLDKIASKPEYPKGRIKYRHYGSIVEDMIKFTKAETNPEVREKMENYLGAYMKLAYKQWNEQKMSDDVIIENIKEMSGGDVVLNKVVDITESILTTASNTFMPKQNQGVRRPMASNVSNNKKRKKKR